MGRPSEFSKDQALLSILKLNARTPISEIAKSLGVSRATAQARLRRLERDGYIAGYTTVPGDARDKIDLLSAIILIELEVRRQVGVIADLKRLPEVLSCHTLSGAFDLFVLIRCQTSTELDRIIDLIAGMEGVKRTNSSIMLARKFER